MEEVTRSWLKLQIVSKYEWSAREEEEEEVLLLLLLPVLKKKISYVPSAQGSNE